MTERDTPKMTHDEMIDVLKGLVFGTFDRTTAKEREALDMAISALSENKGKWEKIWRTDCERSEYVCSKCGCGEDFLTDFCPNCGADMRGYK